MRISIATDMPVGVAGLLLDELHKRGHDVILHGAYSETDPDDWAISAALAAQDVANGSADQGIVCCWTGTGASIAANKVNGIRAALCIDEATASGAREWNDANVLALSLRTTSEAVLIEILDAWFSSKPSSDPTDQMNIAYLSELESGIPS